MEPAAVINPTVLVVEDEALISELISDALLDCGFQVHAVATADDALRYLLDGAPVDLLFTDINLPGEMDGAMLAQQARRMRPQLPIVFASGRWGLLEHLRTVPDAVCLPKPYSPERACTLAQEMVATRQSADCDRATVRSRARTRRSAALRQSLTSREPREFRF